jgi:hypothetical protein
MERHPVEAGVPQSSPVSPILIAIYTAGLRKWVEEYTSEGKVQSFVDDLGRVAIGSDGAQVVMTLERCATKTIEWAGRRELPFDTAKTEAARFTCSQGNKKHHRPKLRAKILVSDGVIWFNCQETCWLGVWMDAHLTLM